jgi:predicted DNA-binding transcriptional regulator YafY
MYKPNDFLILADMFEVSPRTIYRDIDAINMAGVPVRSAPRVGDGFEIMREYKIDKKVFSAADLAAILTGLSGLSDMMHGGAPANALAGDKCEYLEPSHIRSEMKRRLYDMAAIYENQCDSRCRITSSAP